MSEDWVTEIRKIKQETEEEIAKIRSEEDVIREKYEPQKKKIIDKIRAELKPIVEVYTKPELPEMNKPRIEIHRDIRISLKMPIVSIGEWLGSDIDFYLKLTDDGYGVQVSCNGRTNFIKPPVKIETIRKEIKEYLEYRKKTIISKEKTHQHFKREW